MEGLGSPVYDGNLTAMMKDVHKQYPFMAADRDKYVVIKSDRPDNPGLLEAWPPGEGGPPQYPRPAAFPLDKTGIEIYDDRVRPLDVAADYYSHQYPSGKAKGRGLAASWTPEQIHELSKQYLEYDTTMGEGNTNADAKIRAVNNISDSVIRTAAFAQDGRGALDGLGYLNLRPEQEAIMAAADKEVNPGSVNPNIFLHALVNDPKKGYWDKRGNR